MARVKARLRALPEVHGRRTLVVLGLILALGFCLRAYRVAEPLATPGDDARAYYALSKALYAEGGYGGPEFDDASDWSPGAPLLYAASFYATGGAREGTARIVEMLLGLAAVLIVYLLGRRIACGPAGLLAAFAAAVYPPFIHSTGALFSEPPAIFTLPAAVLAFLWAREQEGPWPWLLPGFLFGLTALIRPEYLLVGAAFGLYALIAVWRARGPRPASAATALLAVAFLLPILPWTIRNQVVLDRTVPISTGGGKALFVGTYLPADGEYQRVKALLVERYRDRDLEPGSEQLDEVDPKPLFDRVADRYPDLPRDEALGKIGKQNFYDYLEDDPSGYLAMTVRKVWRMWSAGIGEAMSSTAGRVIQVLVVVLAIAGLLVLGARRRWWDLVAMATPLALVTAVGAASLAAPRRNEVLMTLVFPLAAAALARAGGALSSSSRWRPSDSSPQQASSPPS